jgi:hypothetical protein
MEITAVNVVMLKSFIIIKMVVKSVGVKRNTVECECCGRVVNSAAPVGKPLPTATARDLNDDDGIEVTDREYKTTQWVCKQCFLAKGTWKKLGNKLALRRSIEAMKGFGNKSRLLRDLLHATEEERRNWKKCFYCPDRAKYLVTVCSPTSSSGMTDPSYV